MGERTYRALLIGNSDYPADRNLLTLEGPRNDPALLRDALCDDGVGLVPTDNIRLVPERESAEVLREIETFFQSATSEDVLVLYYSGHGALNFKNELFLCARDTRLELLRSTSIPARDVKEMVDDSRAATTVVLLDCCHSGKFKSPPSGAALAGEGTFVVMSSRAGELADDTHHANRASRFTHHVVTGLRVGAQDTDQDGLVSVNDLYSYVYETMRSEQSAVPQRHFSGDGAVPVARRTRSIGAVEPTPQIEEPPELDIPHGAVDVGRVELGMALPAERVAVVNRGGGTLNWACESTSDWLDATRDGNELVLHLHPPIGKHRGNVYVRDLATGTACTVRVSVEVVEPAPPNDFEPPANPTVHDDSGDLENQGVRPGAPGDSEFDAAWYSDPRERYEYRYFDGTQWTAIVARGGVISDDPLDAPVDDGTGHRNDGPIASGTQRHIGRAVTFFSLGALCGLFVAGGLAVVVDQNDNYQPGDADYWVIIVFTFFTLLFFWLGRRAWRWRPSGAKRR